MQRCTSARRAVFTRLLPLAGAAAAVQILSGPIHAQITPPLATTRTWDNGANGTGAGTFLWDTATNWSADTLPGINDIAAMGLSITGVQNIDLGGVSREVGSLYFSVNSASNYNFINGTIVTNSFNQNQDDANALSPTALVMSKNAGADVLNVSVSSNTLQLQGLVTSGGINKFGVGALRLGTSGTAFNNAINGDITIYSGTLRASAGATAGVNNPLGGSGDIVIGAAGATLELQAQIASGDYDFVRDVRAGNLNFTVTTNNASGTDPGDPNMRLGTLFIGDAVATINSNSGYRTAFDAINMAAGSTATRVQHNSLTFVDGLIGDASSNLYKRGGSELQIRGNSEATFAGDIFLGEGTTTMISTAPGLNPTGGADSTITFSNGYGTTAADGGQLLQLRSDASIDMGANIAFRPNVTIGRISVDRIAAGTGQVFGLGDANISGRLLRISGGNSAALNFDNLIVDAGATGNFDTVSANVGVLTNLVLGAGSTFNKLGGSTLTLGTDNSATALGTINLKAGSITGTVAGSLGSAPMTVGDTTPNSTGILAAFSRLNYNVAGASANATGADAIAVALGVIDLNATPVATDVFDIRADGRIQGNPTQLGALTVGSNLLLSPNAIVVHETPGAATGTVVGLANDASVFYGISNTANTLPTIGAGTPWKGVSGDNTARSIIGTGGVATTININGGDNDPTTIEATFQSMNDVNLDLGSSASAETYQWISTAAGGEKVTLAIRGTLGFNAGLGLTPGGRVILRDDAASTGLSTAVDKVIVQSGTFGIQTLNSLGGVPVDVLNGGGLDLPNLAGNIVDGNVAIKSGGVLFINDPQVLSGSGTITIESGGKLDLTSVVPANFFTASTQAVNFTGTGHTVRFGTSDLANLDTTVPNAGVTYVITSGATAANIPGTNVSVTTNTQSAGLTFEGGILTNDTASRGLSGQITLVGTSDVTFAASRGTTLVPISSITAGGNVNVGSLTAIDFRDKTGNPDRVDGLGRYLPYDGSGQVVFPGAVSVAGNLTARDQHVGFGNASTNITGDLTVNEGILYLDAGGPLDTGTSVPGELTPRLTSTTGLVADRVANRIIIGEYSRFEVGFTSPASGTINHDVTQPFVIAGKVAPADKRTFWANRSTGAATTNLLFSDITLNNNSEFGVDENNTVVRVALKMDGNARLMRNHDDYDIRSVTRTAGAPANVTLTVGEPAAVWDNATESFINGSNATLTTLVDGTIGAGVTVDIARSTFVLESSAVLDGTIRTQNAPLFGDSILISRSSGSTSNTTLSGAGEIQLGRSVAAAGPEDFDIRATEQTNASALPAQVHTVNVPVRVLNDGTVNIDGVVRSDRHNDSDVLGRSVLNTLDVDAGATVQLQANNQTRLTVNTVNLGANSGIDSMNSTTVFVGNIAGGANTIRITGPAQTRVTGNITAGQINVSGAGLDFDSGTGNTSTANAPVALDGLLSVRSGTADLGTNVITGAATQMVAGLREHKFQGNPIGFDLNTPNSSNQVELSPRFANIAATAGWGEQQTVTYTGQILIPDNGTTGDGLGSIAFAKWFDDSARVRVDGVTVLENTGFNDGVANASGNLPVGWHDIEIRFGQGTGGTGAVGQDGNAFNIGFGIDITGTVSTQTGAGVGLVIDGSQYAFPSDDGSMNLFRTTTLKSPIALAANTTLRAGGFTNIGAVTASGASGILEVTAAGSSDAESIIVAASASGTVRTTAAGATVTVQSLALTGNLVKDGPGTLLVNGLGTGAGTVTVSDGTLGGSGTIAGSVLLLDGVLAPGNSPGTLGTGSINLQTNATLSIEIGGLTAGTQHDQVNVTGGITLAGDLQGSLINGFIPQTNDAFVILLNDGADAISGFFSNAPSDGSTVLLSGIPFTVDYTFDGGGDLNLNDVALIAQIPEPTSAAVLAAGMGLLAGLRRFRRRH